MDADAASFLYPAIDTLDQNVVNRDRRRGAGNSF
jgi:hypothetical protein